MTIVESPIFSGGGVAQRPALDVVVCGSYRRAPDALREEVVALAASGCRVLSPTSLDFIDGTDGFVRLADQLDDSVRALEQDHLNQLRRADFVWLHAPGGYVGSSGAFELGVAHVAGVPVFCRECPADVTLREFVTVVGEVDEVLGALAQSESVQPGQPLSALQAYYARVSARRGWDVESAPDCMLLLTEEVGELARAVRLTVGLARHSGPAESNPAEELADVQLYLVHLANTLGLDLASAVTEKEASNRSRFDRWRRDFAA